MSLERLRNPFLAVVGLCLGFTLCIAAEPQTSLRQAVRQNDVDAVKTLIESGADVNEMVDSSNEATALMIAARYGYVEIMKVLIESGADVNAQSGGGYTALMRAARNGQTPAVKLLIENNADIHLKNNGGVSAVWHATHYNHLDIVELFKKHGAKTEGIVTRPQTSNPVGTISRTHAGRQFLEVIEIVGFLSFFGIALLAVIRVFCQPRFFWDLSLLLAAGVVYLFYEAAMAKYTIRVDVFFVYPALFVTVVCGLITLWRGSRAAWLRWSGVF